ncbi:MAG: hypothetical protein ABIW19_05305 [Vicinamibacterales bacterium]
MRGMVIAVLVAWAVVGLPVPAAGQAPMAPRVLVMPFAVQIDRAAPGGAGTALWLGEAASILLSENLSALGVSALSRDERAAVFSRLSLPMSAALTRATTIRVGELVGVSHVVVGEVVLGEKLEVRARLIRLAAGQEMPAVTDSAELATIFDLFSRVALRVAVLTGRPATLAATPARAWPLEAFENYVKGLVANTPAAQQRFLETANRQLPNEPRILMALWSVYTAQSVHDKALAVASAVPADAPQSRLARLAMGLSLIELRRFDGAYQTLSALSATGRSAAVYNALGLVQLRRGGVPPGTASAATYFKRAVDEAPEETEYLFNLGYANALVGNTSEALTWLREVVRFDSADGEAHLVMSAVLTAAGRSAEAQRELELARLLGSEGDAAARSAAPRIPTGLERMSTSLELTPGRVSAAIANPSQRDQRETALFHLSNGRSLVVKRRDREATNELRRAIYLAPYEDEPHLLLGGVYQRAGQLPQAVDEFKVAIWCKESAPARLALAGALLEIGDRPGARREAQRALVLAPGSAEARDLLARIGS